MCHPVPTPNFGPHVAVFGPESTDFSAIEARYRVLQSGVTGQFSSERAAFLFLPGSYRVDVPVGYYTSVLGLGRSPEEVRITGHVRSDAALDGGCALCNFWRAVENFTVVPTVDGRMKWAVAQAAPFRRMKVQGDLNLADTGSTPWSSGGFIANSQVTGTVRSLTQQQWLSRHSRFGGWEGGNWNMAFVGVEGAPAETDWCQASPMAVMPTGPQSVEKPFLYVDGGWKVFVPAVRPDREGFDWALSPEAGRTLDLDAFHIAVEGVDTAATLNAALAAGKHLLVTPGIYHLDVPLEVGRAGTVVLGIGFATLTPTGAFPALRVADVDGVRVAGVLVDAGTEGAPTLVEVGRAPGADHRADPTVFHDLVVRVGNGRPAAADTAVTVNSHDVVLDHSWLWVADHDAHTSPLPWRTNPSRSGLVVNGDRVTAYGLFVEHFQEFQTLWNGEEGTVLMYQSELPYHADESWTSAPGTSGFASYKVAPHVTRHQGWALGIYQVFGGPCTRAVKTPEGPGVRFDRVMTTTIVSGSIDRVVNDAGQPAGPGETAWLKTFP